MLNIVRFIWRNNVLFLFLLLEAISFTLIIQANRFHRSSFISSANVVSGSMLLALSESKEYVNLKQLNDSLAKENAKLYSLAKESYYVFNDSSFTIKDTIYQQQYSYIPAKVINNSIYERANYITLNKGSKNGIKADMGVVSMQGVVGTVIDVSEHFSVVMSLLHKDYKLGVMFKKDNAIASLIWDTYDPDVATVIDIPDYVKVKEGDTIVTTSFSTLFPKGVMVGTVSEFMAQSGSEHSKASVKLSVPFAKLSYVYVIENFKKQEQLDLEQGVKNSAKDK